MAADGQNNNGNGKNKSRSQCRRDTENAVFEELAELLPISQDMKHDKVSILRLTIAFLKLRAGLDTDEQDLEQCLAAADDSPVCPGPNPTLESKPRPLAMLDGEGNLIAGTLHPSPTSKNSTSVSLPEKVVSELEKTFLSGSKQADETDINMLKVKFQKYKEGLEKGMQEFLSQDCSYTLLEDNSSFSGLANGVEDLFHHGGTHCARNTILESTAKHNIDTDSRIRKMYKEHKKDTATLTSSVYCDEAEDSSAWINSVPEGSTSLEAASGFILSLDRDKRVLFVSENVSKFLGHCQWSVIGQDVSEFVYEKDYPELERQMNDSQFHSVSGTGRQQPWQVRRTFYVAMNFCFQKPGSRTKDCGFQLYQWNAKLRLYKDNSTQKTSIKGLVSLCCPLQRDDLMSFRDNANFFVVRFSIKDSRILYCDPKIQDLLGYAPSELIGIKHSDLKHPSDILMCRYNYRNLPRDGKCESGYYRLLSRVGIWVWMYSHLNIAYNKSGQPEILTTKNIIVSQAEAERVLSRERANFEKLKYETGNDEFPSGVSVSSIAAFKFQATRKKRRPLLETVPVGGSGRCGKSKSTAMSSEKTPGIEAETSPEFEAEKKCQDKMQDSKHPAHSHATDCRGRRNSQTEREQFYPHDINVDTYQGIASNTSSVSATEHTTDSDISGGMYFEKLAQNLSATLNPSWTGQVSSTAQTWTGQVGSTAQTWTLDALLFDDRQSNTISSLSNSNETLISSSLPLERLTGGTETNVTLSTNNDQIFPLETTLAGQTNSIISPFNHAHISDDPHISGNSQISPQSFPNLVMNDDLLIDCIIEFLDGKSSSDPRLLLTSSGDVMLSSVTAPQPIRPKNSVNKPDFQKSQTIYNNTDWLLHNPRQDIASTAISQETVHSSECSADPIPGTIHPGMDNFEAYSSLADAPPVVSGQSDTIYTPGKLDYPQFQSSPNAKKGSGNLHQSHTRNHPGFRQQAVVTTTLSKQNIHQIKDTSKIDTGYNNCPGSSILTFPETFMDKVLHELDHDTQQENESSNSHVTKHSLPEFTDSKSHILPGDVSNYLMNANIRATARTENLSNKESSAHRTVQQEPTDVAWKLPEDLLDLELDSDWLNS